MHPFCTLSPFFSSGFSPPFPPSSLVSAVPGPVFLFQNTNSCNTVQQPVLRPDEMMSFLSPQTAARVRAQLATRGCLGHCEQQAARRHNPSLAHMPPVWASPANPLRNPLYKPIGGSDNLRAPLNQRTPERPGADFVPLPSAFLPNPSSFMPALPFCSPMRAPLILPCKSDMYDAWLPGGTAAAQRQQQHDALAGSASAAGTPVVAPLEHVLW